MIEKLRADLDRAHQKLDLVLRCFHHILKGNPDMAIHDDILTALTTNDAALLGVGAKASALISAKSASDSVFNDILPRVTAQGQAIAALGNELSAALPAAPVVEAPVEQPKVEAPAEVATDPSQPAIVIPGTAG